MEAIITPSRDSKLWLGVALLWLVPLLVICTLASPRPGLAQPLEPSPEASSDDEQRARETDQMVGRMVTAVEASKQRSEVSQEEAIAIAVWAAQLESTEQTLKPKYIAQYLLNYSVFDPMSRAADARVSAGADVQEADQGLADSIDSHVAKLSDRGVPERWAKLGYIHLAGFRYRWQLLDQAQEALGKSAAHVAKPDIWPGIQSQFWNLRGLLAEQEAQFALAYEHFEKALSLSQAANLPLDVAEQHNNLALLLLRLGDFGAAKLRLDQAKAIYTDLVRQSGDNADSQLANKLAFVDVNLSLVAQSLGDLELAESLLRENLSKPQLGTALNCTCLNNLGVVLYSQGNFAEGRTLLNQSLELSSQVFGPTHIRTLETTVNLAWLDFSSGDNSSAAKRLQTVLKALETSSEGHHRIAEVKGYLARVLAAMGENDDARVLLLSGLADRQAQIDQTLRTALSQRDRLAYVQNLRVHIESIAWPGVFDTFIELADQLGVSAEQQYQHVLAWKGVLQARGSRSTDKDDESVAALRSRWLDVRRAIREYSGRRHQLSSAETQGLRALETEAERLERSMRKRGGASQSLPETLTVVQLLAALPGDCVYIDFLQVRYYRRREDNRSVKANPVYIAFLCRDKKVIRFDLGSAERIDRYVDRFRGRVLDKSATYTSQARDLDRFVTRSLRGAIGDKKRVLICADGALHNVPWGALPGDRSEFWIQDKSFLQVPSSWTLLRTDDAVSATPTWLLVGDVDYGSSAGRWHSLDGAKREVAEVQQTLRKRFADPAADLALTGDDATKARVRAGIADRQIVHLATHGEFTADAPDDETGAFGVRGTAAQLDSYLVFAQANDAANTGTVYLTAEEIMEMDLHQLRLATLSACETGLGHVQAGQSTIGLVAAFQQAGADHVISALWKVDDEATSELMQSFYTRLFETDRFEPAEALRATQLEMLAQPKWRHPYFWAAWTTSGAP